MERYKIVKEISPRSGNELYMVYRSYFFGLLWKFVGLGIDLADAEDLIKIEKQKQEFKRKSKKKEVVGYY